MSNTDMTLIAIHQYLKQLAPEKLTMLDYATLFCISEHANAIAQEIAVLDAKTIEAETLCDEHENSLYALALQTESALRHR